MPSVRSGTTNGRRVVLHSPPVGRYGVRRQSTGAPLLGRNASRRRSRRGSLGNYDDVGDGASAFGSRASLLSRGSSGVGRGLSAAPQLSPQARPRSGSAGAVPLRRVEATLPRTEWWGGARAKGWAITPGSLPRAWFKASLVTEEGSSVTLEANHLRVNYAALPQGRSVIANPKRT